MTEKRRAPINQVHFVSSRIRSTIPFPPWLDDSQIRINTRRTETLMNLGGIRFLKIVGRWDQETSSISPTVVNINSDGSATSVSSSTVRDVPVFEAKNERENPPGTSIQNAIWTNTQISLNMDEVMNQATREQKSLKSPATWVSLLDKPLSSGIRKTGSNHLLLGHNEKGIFTTLLGPTVLLSTHIASRGGSIEPARLAHIGILYSLFYNYAQRLKRGSEYRPSLIPGYEVDRALVLSALSHYWRLLSSADEKRQ